MIWLIVELMVVVGVVMVVLVVLLLVSRGLDILVLSLDNFFGRKARGGGGTIPLFTFCSTLRSTIPPCKTTN